MHLHLQVGVTADVQVFDELQGLRTDHLFFVHGRRRASADMFLRVGTCWLGVFQLKVGKKFGSVSVVVGFSIYTRFGHSFVKSHLDLWYLEPLSGGGEIKYKRVASGGEKVHGDGGGGEI
jgi:hypothetical protein